LGGQGEQTSPFSFDLEYRRLQPGELVRVVVEENLGIIDAGVIFLDKEHPMRPIGKEKRWQAFLGISLDLVPGVYPLELWVRLEDGRLVQARRNIRVERKEFPVRRLWVKEEYVTPPREVRERIQLEAELVRQVYGMFTPEWLGEGNFVIPCSGEARPNFGERRIFNGQPRSPHTGVDISSPLGAPVRASNRGRVVLANDLYFAGKTVIIDHGLGVFTMYAHFSRFLTSRGKVVARGEVIGEVGETGRVTGPHLHWGVVVSGSRVDPFSLLELPFEERADGAFFRSPFSEGYR